jgi:transcriptional regulator with XRE-family HTH domain
MSSKQTLSELLRTLRKQRHEPLRVVAAAIEIDSTLLSKFERGQRFPSMAQLARLAAYFGMPADELVAHAIADRIVCEYGQQTTTQQALNILRERMSTYQAEGEA